MNNTNKNLKTCPSCGKEVSKRAKTCPHCGEKFGRGFMAKVIMTACWVFAGFVALLILIPVDTNESNGPSRPIQSQVDLETWTQCRQNDTYFDQLCKGKQVIWTGTILNLQDARAIVVEVAEFGRFDLRLNSDVDITETPINTEIAFVAEIREAGGVFSLPELRNGRIERVTATADEATAAREATQAAEQVRQAKEAANSCIGNIDLCSNAEEYVTTNEAAGGWRLRCQDVAERSSRYGDIQWGDSFMNSIAFESYDAGGWDAENPVVTLIDRDAQIPNAFGAMQRVTVRCSFNPKSGELIEVVAE